MQHLRTATLAFLVIGIGARSTARNSDDHSHVPPPPSGGSVRAAGCVPATKNTELDLNNVRAYITNSGLLWYDQSGVGRAAYEVPKTADRTGARPLFSGGLWMGGLSPDNQLKLAAIDYRTGNDFWPGPLTTDGDASVTDDVCLRYDEIYPTLASDAETHDAYFRCLVNPDCDLATEGLENYIIPSSYFDWPAINTEEGYDTYLAPFTDVNGDGDYDPSIGDYPGYDLEQKVDCKTKFREDPIPLFGDMNKWWVFNDKGNQHTETGGQPIGLEVKAQAFSFSTNNEVNNMTFYNYVVINRGTQTLNNTYFGQFADPDLGCNQDDFAGCDVQRGLGFVYNWDDVDDGCSDPAYGPQPPAIGIDFFEGPFQDYDLLDNPLSANCQDNVDSLGIPYGGIGIGYGDDIVDNERFGMRGFVYYSRVGANCCTDPSLAVHYYNYLRSIWKDGEAQTYGEDGYNPQIANAVPARYMFPGDSDPVGWGTGCVPQAAWQEQAQTSPDRRFIQSAGPFTLEPGAYNNITVGAVYARAVAGGAFASVIDLRRADDKAQALFDNCFRILDGPDAPSVSIQELDQHLVLYLTNPVGSNNENEEYEERDPIIPIGEDSLYRFQGYQIYQVKDANVSVADLGDVNSARLLAVCDVADSVGRLINYIQDPEIGLPVPTEMVNAPDTGVFHSLRVDFDLFAVGDPRLVNYKTYYYIALAYGYNNYEDFSTSQLTGQAFPFLAGRKAAAGAIRSYSGIPHPPSSEAGGTVQNSQYGDEFAITRIEGQGNGGRSLVMTRESELEILNSSTGRIDQIRYLKSKGPIGVKVVDPLMVPAGNFEVWFRDITALPLPNNVLDYEKLNDATWFMVRLDGQGIGTDTIFSDRTIEVANEQLIPDWGISVTLDQTAYSNSDKFTVPLDPFFEYIGASELNDFWYLPIVDQDGDNAFNWVRSGTAIDDAITYKDYEGEDDGEAYERNVFGWAPFALVGDTAFQPADPLIASALGGAKISETSSTLVVFTPNKEHWTRCVVVEENNIPSLHGGVAKLKLKTSPSIDKNGRQAGDDGYNSSEGGFISATGMSWFPGYAIDVETGERQNMAFGEDSFWGGDLGRDMIWNPNSVLANNQGFALMAGSHWIYTFKNRRRMKSNIVEMPSYDNGQFAFDKLNSDGAADRVRVWAACNWVGSGALQPTSNYLPMEDGFIPKELRIRLNVNKPYLTYLPYPGEPVPGVNIDRNGGLPLYTFSTSGSETLTGVNSVQEDGLSLIGIVPNPYYAFSGYETSRLDNRVKFTNLPRTCVISIYNVGGTLVRKYKKDNDLTYLDWDLKNGYNVPIAGGTYICHIEVPGAGETVLKWFGVMRPVDLQNF
ncbi:MAG: T9SS C-terminal target domain-containing protein [Flavobacteriales bacterium]|nr:T9SS C-terminal target domain-containing protein [Flavobacteriales bacterium]